MGKTIQVGDKTFISKTFSEEDVFRFAEISTDRNPLHLVRTLAELPFSASVFNPVSAYSGQNSTCCSEMRTHEQQ